MYSLGMHTVKVTIFALMVGTIFSPTSARAADDALAAWCADAYRTVMNGGYDELYRDAALKAVEQIRNSGVAMSPEDAQKMLDASMLLFKLVSAMTFSDLAGPERITPQAASPVVRNLPVTTPATAAAPKTPGPTLTAASYNVPPGKPLTTFDSPDGYNDVDPFTTKLVPWLAASGPWAYSPENPPPAHLRDQWSDYGRAMPALLDPGHPYGRTAGGKTKMDDLLEGVNTGDIKKVAIHMGELSPKGEFKAPVAIYKDNSPDGNYYLVQNGNYQVLPIRSQPDLESKGELILYRGVGNHKTWPVSINRFPQPRRDKLDRYLGLRNWYMHSRPDTSFGAAFEGSARQETNHLGNNIEGLIAFRTFAKRFLTDAEISDGEKVFGYGPKHNHNRWYSTRDPAELRFGPNVIAVRTSVQNVTFSSDWNSEQEFHLLDPLKAQPDQETSPGVRPDYIPLR